MLWQIICILISHQTMNMVEFYQYLTMDVAWIGRRFSNLHFNDFDLQFQLITN
ncbi:hypothetical protein DICVIV_05239 [Dictyocaulus viviparus]|uniref:Uncharacterized protein n=1 Tax=Dictyocaulus viviparus TaxID=29172 RepID=A0A0D8XW18_DICVI|nr:hypothetical protein DICVIV_05239 [Dictyocaulus viviparus]